MLTSNALKIALFLACAGHVAACSSGRDVEVTGEVIAPASARVQGAIQLDFLDVAGEGETPSVVQTLKLDAPGAFSQTVSLAGTDVIVRAINDKDGNAACSLGEAWAQAQAKIGEDGKVAPLVLTLSATSCPTN